MREGKRNEVRRGLAREGETQGDVCRGETRASKKQAPKPGLQKKNKIEIAIIRPMHFDLMNQATKCQII